MSNHITLTGNLTADPELRFTPGGDAVTNFTVADTPRKFNKQTNAWEDSGETMFVRCSIWREDAEVAAEHLRKGQRVTVTGKLKQRSYEKDGQTRVSIEMDAESVAGHGQRKSADRAPRQPASDPWATQPTGTVEPPF